MFRFEFGEETAEDNAKPDSREMTLEIRIIVNNQLTDLKESLILNGSTAN